VPHSAEFNAARRVAYAEGRRLGLGRRAAGHLLGVEPKPNSRKPERYLTGLRQTEATAARTTQQRTLAEREAEFAARKSKSLPTNRGTVYTKVRLTLRDKETGQIVKADELGRPKTVTLVDNRRLSRAEALDRIEGFLRNPRNRNGSDIRQVEIVAVDFDEEILYPDVRYHYDNPQEY